MAKKFIVILVIKNKQMSKTQGRDMSRVDVLDLPCAEHTWQ